MNENFEQIATPKSYRVIFYGWLVYLKRILLLALGVSVSVGISFVFTGGFSSRTYSDRLLMVSILIMMVGVFTFITMVGTRKNMGFSTVIKNEEEARKLLDKTDELREKTERRYDLGSQVWSVGLACLVLSILVFYVLKILKI